MQVQQQTYNEHWRNFYDEIAKHWSNTKDDSTVRGDSDSDITTQSSEPNSDMEVSSLDEHVSSPDISDMYTGHETLADIDRDRSHMVKKVQSEEWRLWRSA